MVGQRIQQGLVSDTERFGDFPKNVLVNFSGRLCEISGRIFWDYATVPISNNSGVPMCASACPTT